MPGTVVGANTDTRLQSNHRPARIATGRSADFDCAPGLEGDCNNPGNPDPDPQTPFDPFSKGKGKNKGKGKGTTTPTEPE